jgi:HlyD family secretion protein
MPAHALFRKVALDRLASPEQLDQLMEVTNPRGWIAVAAIGAVLATAIVWSIVGSMPEKVTGQGMLIRSGGVAAAVPLAGGRVTDVAVSVGEQVSQGQVVVWLAQPQLTDQVNDAKATLAQMHRDHERLIAYRAHDRAIQEAYTAEQQRSLTQSIAANRQTLQFLADRVKAEEDLVTQGLLTRPALLNTKQQYQQTEEKLGSLESDLTQLDSKQLSTRNDASQSITASSSKIAGQEAQVAELERQLKAASEVTAPYSGRVLEVMTQPGEVVSAGQSLMTVDVTGRTVSDLQAVIYVSSTQGKRVRPGMPIQIAPSTVKQEEYGLILGKVSYVSDFPATSQGMRRVLENDKLVAALSGQDAPYEVRADLEIDPRSASHYKWSSSGGPPLTIQSGTVAMGYVEVASQQPIEMVIPAVRKWTGL